MPWTRRQQQQLIDICNQNTSQPIYRLSPELISEIFLHGRPDVFAMRDADTWRKLVRYLVDITSITGHLRRIALDYGELWSIVGFHVPRPDVNNYHKRALIVMEAFLERSRGRNLHFYFDDEYSAPSWFYPRLLALIIPHIGRAQTIGIWTSSNWKQLYVLLNNAVNINHLSLYTGGFGLPNPPTPPLNVLHNLKELTLYGIVYDESFHEIMGQVEKLDLALFNTDLSKWLGSFIQLKWLRIHEIMHLAPGLTDSNILVRLESLVHLDVSMSIYHSIAPRLSLPHLRHLNLRPPSVDPHLEPQYYRHPLLRTLSISLNMEHVHLLPVGMNPQLEYLEINLSNCLTPLSKLLWNPSQWPIPLTRAIIFPRPSLKYFRLIYTGRSDVPSDVDLWKRLRSILTKAPHLKLDAVAQRAPPGFRGLKKQFPSQVKRYEGVDCVPLDELYERSRKDNE